mmetsp:Transcript_10705/g.26228  ORF Transcript_10705/g.26228 Transcript_10705/m.26228 type:complete len:92 (+) Transcript_10705:1959-2234(+)
MMGGRRGAAGSGDAEGGRKSLGRRGVLRRAGGSRRGGQRSRGLRHSEYFESEPGALQNQFKISLVPICKIAEKRHDATTAGVVVIVSNKSR